jgi:hypothetical protein
MLCSSRLSSATEPGHELDVTAIPTTPALSYLAAVETLGLGRGRLGRGGEGKQTLCSKALKPLEPCSRAKQACPRIVSRLASGYRFVMVSARVSTAACALPRPVRAKFSRNGGRTPLCQRLAASRCLTNFSTVSARPEDR